MQFKLNPAFIVALILAVVINSCGSVKKLTKSQIIDSVQVTRTLDANVKKQETNNAISTKSTSVELITEKIDTSIVIKGDTLVGQVAFEQDSFFTTKNDIKVELYKNKKDGKIYYNISTSSKSVPIIKEKITNRTTTTQSIDTSRIKRLDSSIRATTDSTSKKATYKGSEKDVKRGLGSYLILILIAGIIIVGIYIFKKFE